MRSGNLIAAANVVPGFVPADSNAQAVICTGEYMPVTSGMHNHCCTHAFSMLRWSEKASPPKVRCAAAAFGAFSSAGRTKMDLTLDAAAMVIASSRRLKSAPYNTNLRIGARRNGICAINLHNADRWLWAHGHLGL